MRKLKSHILLWMLVIIVPLLSVLAAYNVYILKILNSQMAANYRDTLLIYERPIKKDMDYIAYTMANMLANNTSMLQLNYATNYTEAYVCCHDIAADYRGLVNSELEGLTALGVYSQKNDIERMVYAESAGYSYEEKMELQKKIKQEIGEPESYKKGWHLVLAGEQNYLCRILTRNNNYVTIVIDLSKIFMPQDEKDGQETGYMFYTDEKNQPLTMRDFFTENEIELTAVDGEYEIVNGKDRRFMLVEKEFPYAGLRQYYISPYRGIFQYINFAQVLLLVITLLFAGLIPIGFYYMKRTLFNPLESLTKTMKRIGKDEIDIRMNEEYGVEEFKEMQDSFNAMIDKIEKLKIDAYERELKLKNVQLQYLQIQIRPHFFLNCLKNIQALNVQREHEKIEEMIIALSGYLRSMLKSNPTFITLGEEMNGVKNYIALQQMCQSRPIECRIDIAPELEEILIPPLSIITFLENSIKHGRQENKKFVLSIRASILTGGEKENFLCITILDNGPGFGPEILSEGGKTGQGVHIGILNIKERVKMLYGEKATILFGNSNGACVEMFLPIDAWADREGALPLIQ